MKKYEFYILRVITIPSDEYFSEGGWANQREAYFLFKKREDAVKFAEDGDDYIEPLFEEYNMGELYHFNVSEEVVRENYTRYFESVEEFEEWLDDCDNDGEIRDYDDFVYEELIYDNDNYEYVECANYDFSESIEDKLLVIWQWETHVGYCRKFLGLRLGEYGETVKNCLKADACYRRQVDVLDDANVTDESELYELLFGQYTSWKWNNPRAVERAIEEWCGMYIENKED